MLHPFQESYMNRPATAALPVIGTIMAAVLAIAGCQGAEPYSEYEATEDAFRATSHTWQWGWRGTFGGSVPLRQDSAAKPALERAN